MLPCLHIPTIYRLVFECKDLDWNVKYYMLHDECWLGDACLVHDVHTPALWYVSYTLHVWDGILHGFTVHVVCGLPKLVCGMTRCHNMLKHACIFTPRVNHNNYILLLNSVLWLTELCRWWFLGKRPIGIFSLDHLDFYIYFTEAS